MKILMSEYVRKDTAYMIPKLYKLPEETNEEFNKRVLESSVKIEGLDE